MDVAAEPRNLWLKKALMHAFNQMPQTGWIRGDAAANEQVLEQSNKALQENAVLRAELTMLKAIPSANFENLADLDDLFIVRYQYRYSGRTGGVQYPNASVILFVDFPLSRPHWRRTDALISIAVKQAANEAKVANKPYSFTDIYVAFVLVFAVLATRLERHPRPDIWSNKGARNFHGRYGSPKGNMD